MARFKFNWEYAFPVGFTIFLVFMTGWAILRRSWFDVGFNLFLIGINGIMFVSVREMDRSSKRRRARSDVFDSVMRHI